MEVVRSLCDDLWSWDSRARSPEVHLPSPFVAHFHPGWSSGTAAVRGTKILNNARYYWEVKLSNRVFGTSMMFGVGTARSRLHANTFTNLLGEDTASWGLSHKGLTFHNGRASQFMPPFAENQPTTIGVFFDGVAGTITYYKDGVNLGVAFTGLEKVQEPLYPMVSSTAAKTKMRLANMKRDFVNLQDRCRAVIVASLANRAELDSLWLPPKMKQYIVESMYRAARDPAPPACHVLEF